MQSKIKKQIDYLTYDNTQRSNGVHAKLRVSFMRPNGQTSVWHCETAGFGFIDFAACENDPELKQEQWNEAKAVCINDLKEKLVLLGFSRRQITNAIKERR